MNFSEFGTFLFQKRVDANEGLLWTQFQLCPMGWLPRHLYLYTTFVFIYVFNDLEDSKVRPFSYAVEQIEYDLLYMVNLIIVAPIDLNVHKVLIFEV